MNKYIDISKAFGSSLVEKAGASTALNSFVPIKKVAEVKNISCWAVRLSIQNDKYIAREVKVQGGISYEILISSLEPDIQGFLKPQKEAFYYPIIQTSEFIPDTAKTIALAKIDLVKQWSTFRIKYTPKHQGDKVFIEMYNSGEYLKRIFKILGKTSRGSLQRWKQIYDEFGTWEALAPQYRYSSLNHYKTILTDEMIEVFLKLLLHPNQFNIGKAINLTIQILKTKGVENIPSIPTFRRYAENFKKYNYDKWILMREGEKALKDKVEPYIERDISKLEVGDVLIADGHKLNFQVINPFTGKPTRATLVGFLDWKSGALVGYEIMLEENTQCIASALRMAILNLDIIPKIVYQDNGRAFRAKYFQDCDFEELGFSGVYQNLGIKSVFAKPYNARAKVIERFFLEFQEEFEKLLPSYTGTSIQTKPARLMRNEKLHKQMHTDFIPTIEQAIGFINYWLDYKHSKGCPNDKSRSIQEVLDSVEKQNIDKNKLDDLMLKTDLKTIQRNGIRFLQANYYHDKLYGLKERVVVRYCLFDLTKVKIYSSQGEFICEAKRVEKVHPMAYHMGNIKDMEDFKQKIQKQQKLKNKTLKAVKKYLPAEDILTICKSELYLNNLNEAVRPFFTKSEILEKEGNFLKTQMEEEIIETNVIELKPSKQKSRDEQISKRFFTSDYEKYEWLIKNGCTNFEDRNWLAKYIKSDEYKEIYE